MPKTRSVRRKTVKKGNARVEDRSEGADGVDRRAMELDRAEEVDEAPEIIRLAGDDDATAAGNVFNAWQQLIHKEKVPAVDVIEQSIPRIACADDDITLHVRPETRAKIWRHEYINIASLLNRDVSRKDEPRQLFINNMGMLESRSQPSRSIYDINQWTDAFLIYMSIYIRKYKDCAVELTQYMATIRDAAATSSGTGWRSYDEQFRLRQAFDRLPWDKVITNLWVKLIIPRNAVVAAQPVLSLPTQMPTQTVMSSPSPSPQISYGNADQICRYFNSRTGCTFRVCRFSHVCSACKGRHPEYSCSRLQNFDTMPEQNSFRGGFNASQRGQNFQRGGRGHRF